MGALRTFAAAAATAIGLLLVFPSGAAAHGFTTAQLSSPSEDAKYEASPEIAGRFFHGTTGIDRVELSIFRDGEGAEGCTTPSLGSIAGNGEDEVQFSTVLPELPCNGRYTVTAHAVAGDPTLLHSDRPEATVSRTFQLVAPPAAPSGLEANYDERVRRVSLSWEPNEEVDLLGYLVERAVDDGEFEVIADVTEPEYEDETVASEGGLHLYRVRAVRAGPSKKIEAIAGDSSDEVEVGVEAVKGGAATTAPPPTLPPDRGSVNLSGFGNLQQAASRPVRSAPPVTIDTGFEETLPFQTPPPQEEEVAAPPATGPEGDPGRVVFDYVGGGGPDLRAVLIPAAGAMALLVGALQIRYLLRRAGTPQV
jgi:hypothetical protein